jgi:hypothetical protein
MTSSIRSFAALGLIVSGVCAVSACAPPAPPTQPTIQAAATQVAPTVQAAATQVAPTVQAAGTQVAPTVQAAQTAQRATVVAVAPTVQLAATQAVGTAQAVATQVAPTAQAVATQVAPTVQAVATQAVSAVGTSVATSPVQITNVVIDQTDTQIAIRNSGTSSVNLRNWTLLIGQSVAVTLPDIDLEANQTRTLHLAPGTDTATDVYLGLGSGLVSATLSPGERVVLVSTRDGVASIYRPT